MLLLLSSLLCVSLVATGPIPPPPPKLLSPWGDTVAPYGDDYKQGCVKDDTFYYAGQVVSAATPCDICVCRPPEVVCTHTTCPGTPACRQTYIDTNTTCCPEFQCNCEHNGQFFNNGETINVDADPCKVCYCRGGDVACTELTCYTRDDCVPEVVPGRCCPKYEHCRPLGQNGGKHTTIWPITTYHSQMTSPLNTIDWHHHATAKHPQFDVNKITLLRRIQEMGESDEKAAAVLDLETATEGISAEWIKGVTFVPVDAGKDEVTTSVPESAKTEKSVRDTTHDDGGINLTVDDSSATSETNSKQTGVGTGKRNVNASIDGNSEEMTLNSTSDGNVTLIPTTKHVTERSTGSSTAEYLEHYNWQSDVEDSVAESPVEGDVEDSIAEGSDLSVVQQPMETDTSATYVDLKNENVLIQPIVSNKWTTDEPTSIPLDSGIDSDLAANTTSVNIAPSEAAAVHTNADVLNEEGDTEDTTADGFSTETTQKPESNTPATAYPSETWEHYRPTQMVTDDIQYVTTTEPFAAVTESVLYATGSPATETDDSDVTIRTNVDEKDTGRYEDGTRVPQIMEEETTSDKPEQQQKDVTEKEHDTTTQDSAEFNNLAKSDGQTENGTVDSNEIEPIVATEHATINANQQESGSLLVVEEKPTSTETSGQVSPTLTSNENANDARDSEKEFLDVNSTANVIDTISGITTIIPDIEVSVEEFNPAYQKEEDSAIEEEEAPLPVVKLSEDMINHQMDTVIQMITTPIEDSAEGTLTPQVNEAEMPTSNEPEIPTSNDTTQEDIRITEIVTPVEEPATTTQNNNETGETTTMADDVITTEEKVLDVEHTKGEHVTLDTDLKHTNIAGEKETVDPLSVEKPITEAETMNIREGDATSLTTQAESAATIEPTTATGLLRNIDASEPNDNSLNVIDIAQQTAVENITETRLPTEQKDELANTSDSTTSADYRNNERTDEILVFGDDTNSTELNNATDNAARDESETSYNETERTSTGTEEIDSLSVFENATNTKSFETTTESTGVTASSESTNMTETEDKMLEDNTQSSVEDTTEAIETEKISEDELNTAEKMLQENTQPSMEDTTEATQTKNISEDELNTAEKMLEDNTQTSVEDTTEAIQTEKISEDELNTAEKMLEENTQSSVEDTTEATQTEEISEGESNTEEKMKSEIIVSTTVTPPVSTTNSNIVDTTDETKVETEITTKEVDSDVTESSKETISTVVDDAESLAAYQSGDENKTTDNVAEPVGTTESIPTNNSSYNTDKPVVADSINVTNDLNEIEKLIKENEEFQFNKSIESLEEGSGHTASRGDTLISTPATDGDGSVVSSPAAFLTPPAIGGGITDHLNRIHLLENTAQNSYDAKPIQTTASTGNAEQVTDDAAHVGPTPIVSTPGDATYAVLEPLGDSFTFDNSDTDAAPQKEAKREQAGFTDFLGNKYGSAEQFQDDHEKIFAELQPDNEHELGKYDLTLLQDFFKNLYISDDPEEGEVE